MRGLPWYRLTLCRIAAYRLQPSWPGSSEAELRSGDGEGREGEKPHDVSNVLFRQNHIAAPTKDGLAFHPSFHFQLLSGDGPSWLVTPWVSLTE